MAWLELDAFVRKKVPTAVVKLLTELQGGRTEEKDTKPSSEKTPDSNIKSPAKVTVDDDGKVVSGGLDVPGSGQDAASQKKKITHDLINTTTDTMRAKCELLTALYLANDAFKEKALATVEVIGTRAADATSKKVYETVQVFVTRDVAAYELVLVPIVKGLEAIHTVDKKAKARERDVPATVLGEDNNPIEFLLRDMTVQTEDAERFMPPYWCVRHGVASKVNMEREEMNAEVLVRHLSKDAIRGKSRNPKNVADNWSIPVMTNAKALAKGAELWFLRTERDDSNRSPPPRRTRVSEAPKEFKREMDAASK